MKNVYHRDIMEILLPRGRKGMRLCKIARKIYNMHADLFDSSIDYHEMRKSISNYMWKQSCKRESPFVRNKYGIYAVRTDLAVQLDLFWDFSPKEENQHKIHEEVNHIQLELF